MSTRYHPANSLIKIWMFPSWYFFLRAPDEGRIRQFVRLGAIIGGACTACISIEYMPYHVAIHASLLTGRSTDDKPKVHCRASLKAWGSVDFPLWARLANADCSDTVADVHAINHIVIGLHRHTQANCFIFFFFFNPMTRQQKVSSSTLR